VGKFSSRHKFASKNAQYVAENPPILGKFGDKIKILSTHNFLCQKFAATCRKFAAFVKKLQLPAPPTFF